MRYIKSAPVVSQQVTIGKNGTSNLSRLPFYGLYDYSQMGAIYLAENLSAAGLTSGSKIDALEFQFYGWGTNYTANNQIIKMTHTPVSKFPDPADSTYFDIGVMELETVKSNFTIVVPKGEDWEKFEFDNAFTWDGVSNILISWENRDGSWASGYGYLEGSYEKNRSHAWFEDKSYPVESSSWDNYRPNLKLWFK